MITKLTVALLGVLMLFALGLGSALAPVGRPLREMPGDRRIRRAYSPASSTNPGRPLGQFCSGDGAARQRAIPAM